MINKYQILRIKDEFRSNMLKFTIKAYELLPDVKKPIFLDLGCGTGVPALELVKSSGGSLTGIDNNLIALKLFEEKVKEAGLQKRITLLTRSIKKVNLNPDSFDIIWSEGSIYPIGFERGINYWKKFLRDGGYMVIHDNANSMAQNMEILKKNKFSILDHFIIDGRTWWEEYYSPLEEKLHLLMKEYSTKKRATSQLQKELDEVEIFKKSPAAYGSVFYIVRKE